jgi:D-alanyl-lipoteichoic acid acyltransferase DltB (MBOAT superfamily)
MSIKEDVIEMKREVESIKQESLAMELVRDSKRSNKRMAIAFTIIIVILCTFWFITLQYLIQTLNNIQKVSTVTETKQQTISDVDTMNDNQIVNGDYNDYNK